MGNLPVSPDCQNHEQETLDHQVRLFLTPYRGKDFIKSYNLGPYPSIKAKVKKMFKKVAETFYKAEDLYRMNEASIRKLEAELELKKKNHVTLESKLNRATKELNRWLRMTLSREELLRVSGSQQDSHDQISNSVWRDIEESSISKSRPNLLGG